MREHVLVKAKKLYEHERELMLQRFQLIKRGYRVEGLESKVRYLQEASREQIAERLAAIDGDMLAKIAELDEVVKFVLQANEPTVLEQGGFERIAELARLTYHDETGAELPVITHDEASCLQIKRGSLTESERLEINSHVKHTYDFLKRDPVEPHAARGARDRRRPPREARRQRLSQGHPRRRGPDGVADDGDLATSTTR